MWPKDRVGSGAEFYFDIKRERQLRVRVGISRDSKKPAPQSTEQTADQGLCELLGAAKGAMCIRVIYTISYKNRSC